MEIDKTRGWRRIRALVLYTGAVIVLLSVGVWTPEGLMAQTNPAASSPQMRHFWHVFIAYAAAWILIFGWVFSIFRRLGRVEGKLDARQSSGA